MRRIARKIGKLRPEDFVDAGSFRARDKIMRIFAAECYALAKKAKEQKQERLALQYSKLSAKLLNMSLRPKKLQDLDAIKRTIAKMKKQEARENVNG